MMRWATSGERYAAPPETARMPAINSRGSPDLSHEATDTEAQSLGYELILGERGQHHQRRVGCHPAELLGGGQSVETGHPDVEQGDVRSVPQRQVDGLAPVGGSATTSSPGSVARMVRTPTRIIASSSASNTRITRPA